MASSTRRPRSGQVARFLTAAATLVASLGAPTSDARAAGDLRALDRNGDGRVVIACLGDSNTDSNWQYVRPQGFPPGGGWCEQLGSLLDGRATMVNLGMPGSTAAWTELAQAAEKGYYFTGETQLEHAIATHCPDVVLMAFGTNDVLPRYGYSPEQIVAAHLHLVRRALEAGILPFVATAPTPLPVPNRNVYSRPVEVVAELNQRLRRALPPEMILDFEARLTPEDSFDDLHMNVEGQRKRALEAKEKLEAAVAALPVPPPAPLGAAFDEGRCRVCPAAPPPWRPLGDASPGGVAPSAPSAPAEREG